ncbi:MAG: DUF3365 domain-containing protein [Deltaproteobacteria bacterium]|nr:DUF3365 domain-containing protein [Deltaproteobacteria bacterium]
MKRRLVLSLISVFAFSGISIAAEGGDITLEHKKDNAAANAAEIIEMRSSLAKEFIKPDTEITEDTFKKVCGAVKKRVMEITEKENVKIRHATLKNRNAANAATPEEAELIKKFSADNNMTELRDTVRKDGKEFFRYTRPIYVEEACLACHGSKDARPKFIVEKYPEDKAYDYKAGDLRGIISVLVPLN